MTKNERMENLVEFLQKSAKERDAEAKEQKNSYLKGYSRGIASAYKLCAQWIAEILEG